MNKKIFNPGLLIVGLSYYLLPGILRAGPASLKVLPVYLPVIVFVAGLYSAFKYGRSLGFSILLALAFLPTILIYKQPESWVYAPIYGLLSLVASFLGDRPN